MALISGRTLRERFFFSGEQGEWTARLLGGARRDPGRLRLMMYCASNVGLGHLHRLTRVAAALRHEVSDLDVLLVTDTQNLTAEEIDAEMALVRLPEFEFTEGTFRNQASGLGLKKQELRDLRANILLAAASGFQPDILLMDTNPHGKRNELEPLLKQLAKRRHPPLRLLQMRDIPFPPQESSRLNSDPERLRADFELYDAIFVAGDPGFFDLARNYGWADVMVSKLNYLGFVVEVAEKSGKAPGAESSRGDAGSIPGAPAGFAKAPTVERWEGEGGAVAPEQALTADERVAPLSVSGFDIVAAMGGGWDLEGFGHPIIDAYLRLHPERSEGNRLTLVTGPAVAREDFDSLQALVKGRPDIRMQRYTRGFTEHLSRCDLAILQAGSTPFQILESDVPILLYSRDYSTQEQQVRAERLESFPGIGRLAPADMEPETLAGRIRDALAQPRTPRQTGFGFDGAATAARTIVELLGKKDPERA